MILWGLTRDWEGDFNAKGLTFFLLLGFACFQFIQLSYIKAYKSEKENEKKKEKKKKSSKFKIIQWIVKVNCSTQ